MEVIIVFVSSFSIVFLLGFQQLNVTARRYTLAALTSIAIGVFNYILLRVIPTGDFTWMQFSSYLLGGAAGIVSAMYFHDRFFPDKS